jgi:hypothetical protein
MQHAQKGNIRQVTETFQRHANSSSVMVLRHVAM